MASWTYLFAVVGSYMCVCVCVCADGVPCYKGSPFVTSGGPVTSPLPDAWVK